MSDERDWTTAELERQHQTCDVVSVIDTLVPRLFAALRARDAEQTKLVREVERLQGIANKYARTSAVIENRLKEELAKANIDAANMLATLTDVESELAAARAAYDHIAERYNEQCIAESEHCKDCCCARSWIALGVVEYTGKSIPEHIKLLCAELAALRKRIEDAPLGWWNSLDSRTYFGPTPIQNPARREWERVRILREPGEGEGR